MEFVNVSHARIPALGFGTWQLTGNRCRDAVLSALEIGYRHFDTAQMYENEGDVGLALAQSGVPRDALWLTTKLGLDSLDAERVEPTTRESLERLGVDYLDLLLIHWPSEDVALSETLAAMQELRQEGLVRHIGVSNFTPKLMAEALGLAPVLANQVECHPYLQQRDLRELARRTDTAVIAYSPLARGEVANDQTLRAIGTRHHKTPFQIALRWLLQKQNIVAIPKAESFEHARENFALFDFELGADEMRHIDALDRGQRMIDPDWAPRWGEQPGAS